MDFLDLTFYGNTVQRWAIALAVGLGTLVLLRLVRGTAARRLKRLAERTHTRWDDLAARVLAKTNLVFLLLIAAWAGALVLALPPLVRGYVETLAVLAFLAQAGVWASAAVSFGLDRYREERMAKDAAAVTSVSAVGFIVKLVLWTLVLLLALDNLGVNITTLVAGLGVGGIAVALAMQNILGDLFASLTIVLDKPFVIGDFLIIGDFLGTVEHVGLKTTRLRSLSGEQLIFSNNDLLGSRIRNYGRMSERRVVLTIGVTYQTPRERLVEIPQIIREAVEAQERTRLDRCHFARYGDFALIFETVYYVTVPDYNTYMDIQQAINLRIHERFEEAGIEFAYPTQTLFVVQQGGEPA